MGFFAKWMTKNKQSYIVKTAITTLCRLYIVPFVVLMCLKFDCPHINHLSCTSVVDFCLFLCTRYVRWVSLVATSAWDAFFRILHHLLSRFFLTHLLVFSIGLNYSEKLKKTNKCCTLGVFLWSVMAVSSKCLCPALSESTGYHFIIMNVLKARVSLFIFFF